MAETRKVSKRAWKLYERMCASRAGWGQRDFHTVYTGFGFTYREGRDRVYYHEDHPTMKPAMVGRHNELSKAYTDTAIDRIGSLIQIEGLTMENTR